MDFFLLNLFDRNIIGTYLSTLLLFWYSFKILCDRNVPTFCKWPNGGGGGVNRFSDRQISQKKLFGFRVWRRFYTDLRILSKQRIADQFGSDCGFGVSSSWIVTSYSRAFSGFKFRRQDHCRIADFASNLGGSADLNTPLHHPTPPPKLFATYSTIYR